MLALGLFGPPSGSARTRHAARHVPQGFVGMVVDEPVWPDPFINLPAQLDAMATSGVQSVRSTFDWANMQPYKSWKQVPRAERRAFTNVGGLPTSFFSSDQLVGQAAQRGITVLPVILDAPSWDAKRWKGGILKVPRANGPYAAFAKALVRRYGPRGTFWAHRSGIHEPIRAWQIWNEPTILAFWPPKQYPGRYETLLKAAHDAIKGADPHAKIVLAGLPNYSWFDLSHLYRIRGARSLFDEVAVHPYTKSPQGVLTILGYVRQVMAQNGDARKPLIADEISWPSSLGKTTHNVGYDFATTESGQAKNVSTMLPLLVRNRTRLGLAAFYYYDWAGMDRRNYLAFDFAGLMHLGAGGFKP